MPIDFPNSPTNGQSYTVGDKTWTYNGSVWILSVGTVAIANAAIDVDKIDGGTATNGYFLRVNTSANSGIKWESVPTINNLDDVGDVTITSAASGHFLKWNGTAWVNDAIDLGTDTTGNYMSGVTAGTGVTVTHTPSEGSSATVGIGQDVATSAAVQFASVTTTGNASIGQNLVVTGNLTVSGNTTTLNTETLLIEDNQIVLNSGQTGSPTTNAGIIAERGTSADVEIRWNETTDKWQLTNDGTTFSNIATASDVAGITITTLDDIGDVAVTGVTSGKVLQYNGSAWVAATVSSDVMTDSKNAALLTMDIGA